MVRPIDISNVLNSLQFLGQSNQRLAEIERQKQAKKTAFGGSVGGILGGIVGGYFGGPAGAAAGGAAGSALGQRAAGGDPDGAQVAQSGYQGYQMGSAMESRQQQQAATQRQNQQNQQFNSALATSIEQQENPTPQQLQLAKSLKNSTQNYKSSIEQAKTLGYTPKVNPNAAIISEGQNAYGRLKEEYSDVLDGNLVTSPERKQEFLNKANRIKTIISDPNLSYDVSIKALNNIAPQPQQTERVTYKQEDGKNFKITTSDGQIIKKEEISAEDMPGEKTTSPTLKTSAESLIGEIISGAGEGERLTPSQLSDIKTLQQLSLLPAKNETQAQKQIDRIRSKYVTEDEGDWESKEVMLQKEVGGDFEREFVSYNPDTQQFKYGGNVVPNEMVKPISKTGAGTKTERESNKAARIIKKWRDGKPLSFEDKMWYNDFWIKNAEKQTVVNEEGEKFNYWRSGYPKPDVLEMSPNNPQSNTGAVRVSKDGGQQSGVANLVDQVSTGNVSGDMFSRVERVGERQTKKAAAHDFETIKSLNQYANALDVMGNTYDAIGWANYLSVVPKGDDITGWLISKTGAGGQRAQDFLAAYRNTVVAMQEMVKGNPSDRDIAFMLRSTAELTNDPEYNAKVIQYNKTQVKNALLLKMQMMVADNKKIPPIAISQAKKIGITEGDIYSAKGKNQEKVYEENINRSRRQFVEFASQAGDAYKPISQMKGSDGNTYVISPARNLVSVDNKMFDDVQYTPKMAKQIIKDRTMLSKMSRKDKLRLARILEDV